jgi:hypothetical protein
MMMGANKSEKFKRVCDGVWHDRESILSGRGGLSGEAALMRAVYWRLCKAWGGSGTATDCTDRGRMFLDYQRLVRILLTQHAGSHFDGTPLLNELVRQYREETGQAAESRRELKARSG